VARVERARDQQPDVFGRSWSLRSQIDWQPPRSYLRHIFLIGFMAVGKTTVGRLAAEMLGLPFVDLDDEVESALGMPVRAIFAAHGEDVFRRHEAEALARVADGPAAVVAAGGGAPCHGDNLTRMRAHGLVIALTAPLDVIQSRVAGDEHGGASTRPLLAQPAHQVQALYDARLPIYRQAHAGLRIEHRPPADLAADVVRLVHAGEAIPDHALAHAVLVALSERTYPVLIVPDSLDHLGDRVRAALGPAGARSPRVAVISDHNVAPLHGARARAALERAGFQVCEATVPAGEQSKSIAELSRLCEQLAVELDRGSAIVALGGGVVGDLAGFVAATLFRGIACVQVPTTLVAMVDSAIGGKAGINLDAGKNLMGAFWQPRLVHVDPRVLETLPARERRAAFGELVKYALLDGDDLYAAIEALAPVFAGDRTAAFEPALERPLTRVIHRAVAMKSWIVSRDEREQSGERALLNLGHTVGHAIEAAAGYGAVLHGEAVALGLIAACRVSARLGLCPPDLESRVARTLTAAGLDTDLDPWLRHAVLQGIQVDKKRTGQTIGFITVSRPGVCARTALDLGELSRILRR
jgi:shikimate kinase / 3-dehydroquinate synthase